MVPTTTTKELVSLTPAQFLLPGVFYAYAEPEYVTRQVVREVNLGTDLSTLTGRNRHLADQGINRLRPPGKPKPP